MSLLIQVGCVVTWIPWVAWEKLSHGLPGIRGSTFYIGHNFYVSRVGEIYIWMSQNILHVLSFSVGCGSFCAGQKNFRVGEVGLPYIKLPMQDWKTLVVNEYQ